MPDPGRNPSGPAPVNGRLVGRADHRTWLWESPGPPGAQTLLLLHGWMATAALNWHGAMGRLGHEFRVLAPNLRGHGRGGRPGARFSLEGCADDVEELLCELGVPRAVLVGYSMGGALAQVIAARGTQAVGGVVLCATAASFASRLRLRPAVRASAVTASAVARRWPGPAQALLRWRLGRHDRSGVPPVGRPRQPDWALAERGLSDIAAFVEAGAQLNAYDSTAWLAGITVPSAVVITRMDKVVAPWRQEVLAALIPGSRRYLVDAGHDAVIASQDLFVPVLAEACRAVASAAGAAQTRASATSRAAATTRGP